MLIVIGIKLEVVENMTVYIFFLYMHRNAKEKTGIRSNRNLSWNLFRPKTRKIGKQIYNIEAYMILVYMRYWFGKSKREFPLRFQIWVYFC